MWPFRNDKKDLNIKDTSESESKKQQDCSNIKFYYDATNPEEDNEFWTNAVNRAQYENLNKEKRDNLKQIDTILIRTIPDDFCPDDKNYDWDTVITICSDDTGNKYYYLEEFYLSPWDEMFVSSGGEISYELFKEYMLKINNNKYD